MIYGNVDQFYLKDFRVNLIKVYSAMGVFSQHIINDKCWSDDRSKTNAIEKIFEEE